MAESAPPSPHGAGASRSPRLERGQGIAGIALALGFCGIVPVLGLYAAAAGLVLGIVALVISRPGKGWAIAALVVSLVAPIFGNPGVIDGILHGRGFEGKRETEMTQAYLLRALDEYHRIVGRYPPDREDANGQFLTTIAYDATRSGVLLYAYLTGAKGEYAAAVKTAARAYMEHVRPEMTDGYGTVMRYYLLGATSDAAKKPVGGKPLIVSAGPDRQFGDKNARQRKDNLRSDGRTGY